MSVKPFNFNPCSHRVGPNTFRYTSFAVSDSCVKDPYFHFWVIFIWFSLITVIDITVDVTRVLQDVLLFSQDQASADSQEYLAYIKILFQNLHCRWPWALVLCEGWVAVWRFELPQYCHQPHRKGSVFTQHRFSLDEQCSRMSTSSLRQIQRKANSRENWIHAEER